MRCAGLIAAGGLGLRLGPGTPKGLRDLQGESLITHAVRRLCASEIVQVVVAAPAGLESQVESLAAAAKTDVPVTVVTGGVLRQDSVRLMLAALADDVTHVLVHDAARCLAPASLADRVITGLADGSDAVVPVLPVVDTVARVAGEQVLGNVPRADLRLVQTPQGFDRSMLQRAHDECPPEWEATDDASMVARLGVAVTTVAGDPRAMKITTPDDFVVAQAWLEAG